VSRLRHVEPRQLREWLSETHSAETTAALMLAVAYDEGVDADELASWGRGDDRGGRLADVRRRDRSLRGS